MYKIIYPTEDGRLCIVSPAPGVSIDLVIQQVVPTQTYSIIHESEEPSDLTFRDAWEYEEVVSEENTTGKITINLEKSKVIASEILRDAKNKEFAYWDNKANITTVDTNTKVVRQIIVEKYSQIQLQIDSAETVELLKQIADKLQSQKNEDYEVYLNDIQYTPEIVKQNIINSTQYRLDKFAQTRNYDGILSACTYATSLVQKFQIEGQYCVEARDMTWIKLYEIMTEVEQGIRPIPQKFEDIESELPPLIWPN